MADNKRKEHADEHTPKCTELFLFVNVRCRSYTHQWMDRWINWCVLVTSFTRAFFGWIVIYDKIRHSFFGSFTISMSFPFPFIQPTEIGSHANFQKHFNVKLTKKKRQKSLPHQPLRKWLMKILSNLFWLREKIPLDFLTMFFPLCCRCARGWIGWCIECVYFCIGMRVHQEWRQKWMKERGERERGRDTPNSVVDLFHTLIAFVGYKSFDKTA